MTTATKSHAQANAEAWMETILSLWDASKWCDDLRSTAKGLHSETREILEDAGAIFDDADQLTDDSYPWTVIYEHVLDRARESALSCEFRSGWHVFTDFMGQELEASEFRIVLTFGGPHLEIRGDVSAYNAAENPELIYSEMGIKPTCLWLSSVQRTALEWFALQFVCC